MPRRLRAAAGGFVYHVLNRAVGRAKIFNKAGDYGAFVKVVGEAHDEVPTRLLAFCLMPNHWHLLVCLAKTENCPGICIG
jgi:putative transposase